MFPHHRPLARGLRPALLLSLVCTATASADEARPQAPQPAVFSAAEVYWGYSDAVGPGHWGDLPGATTCATGQEETPIALETASATPDTQPAPVFNYRPTRVRMVNTGHTVEFQYDPGSSLRVNGREYTLAQFHFHTPSEHTEDGKRFPLEMHLVHKDPSGAIAVVGVFIKQGEHNRTLSKAFSHLPWEEGDHSEPAGATLNASSLLPKERTYFTYHGSLTTPPCTEGVEWFVMTRPIEMADAQIAAFQRLPHLNPSNRPLQRINGRTVYLHTSAR
ncbi:carbonic anhydrase family protein [Pyxidicoccus fallax]|uniref:carbonic anhydrase n=1 Tax=Pyxidicoccus fallax TaxID=394095 RepID=A0A848LES9_9BACT|nr:carbonic anhydrase family protein [Pyxidicoccus fallax]NMO14771.1 carbonic anhydrase family protein [Pyxidicoccus fallax]NPC81671.1 carbonic anhydrase family protein [Pyxidicoccus fallax]